MNSAQILDILWRAAWQGAVVLAAAWAALKLIEKSKFSLPANVRYWIWWLVAAQFILRLVVAPFDFRVLPTHAVPKPVVTETDTFINASGADEVAEPTDQPAPVAAIQKPEPTNLDTKEVILGLWFAGVVFGTIRLSARQLRAQRLLRAAAPAQDERVETFLKQLLPNTKRRPAVLLSQDAPCTLLIGIFGPTIVLPAEAFAIFSDRELEMALAHEVAHYKRRDLLLNLIPTAAETLFFVVPFIGRIRKELVAASEEACDLIVLQETQSPVEYARLLLKSATGPGAQNWGAAVGTAFHSQLLQRRITMITESKSSRRSLGRRWLVATPLIALAAIPWTLSAQTPVSPAAPAGSMPAGSAPQIAAPAGSAPIAAPAQAPSQIELPAATQAATPLPSISTPAVPAFAPGGRMAMAPRAMPAFAMARPAKLDKKSTQALNKTISLKFNHASLEQALAKVFAAAKVDFVIQADLAHDHVTGSLTKVSVKRALSILLKSSSHYTLGYGVRDGIFTIYRGADQQVFGSALPMSNAPFGGRFGGGMGQGGFGVAADAPTSGRAGGFGGSGSEMAPEDVPVAAPAGGGFGIPGAGGLEVPAQPAAGGSPGFGGGTAPAEPTAAAPDRIAVARGPILQRVVSVKLHDADVRDSLRSLFHQFKVNYTLAKDVKGTVSAELKDVSLELALSTILKQVDSTYNMEGNTINVIHRS